MEEADGGEGGGRFTPEIAQEKRINLNGGPKITREVR